MGFNGSGVWTWPSLPGSFNPAISGQAATPTDWNTYLTAGAAGLSAMICKDGQSIVSADIPFAGFRLKGVGAGILPNDAAIVAQIAGGAGIYADDTGAVNHIALAPTPATTAYVVGQHFAFKANHTTTITTPDAAVSGLSAGTIVWPDGSALRAGDIFLGGQFIIAVSAVLAGTPTFQLQTVATPAINQSTTGPTTQNFTSGSAATYTTPAGVKWIKVRMVGAGGGAGGIGLTTGPDGSDGGDSIFNSIHAKGGGHGGGTATFASGTAGIGGTAGTGTATFRVTGQAGGQAAITANGAGESAAGGNAPFFCGAGQPAASESVATVNGNNGVANTGGGGSGSIAEGSNALGCSGGGGGGEYLELIISNPAGTYVYTVGAVGAGGIGTGTSAGTGGSGAAGFITVEEHYNL